MAYRTDPEHRVRYILGAIMDLKTFDEAIRRIWNFPKPGINFYDITSVLGNAEAFRFTIDRITQWSGELQVDVVVGVEARGFIFAAPVAEKRGIPLILARKKGKLPGEVWCQDYDLEYGVDAICIQKSDIPEGSRVLLVDDLIATGGTFKATAAIVEKKMHSTVAGFTAVIGLPALGYEKVLTTAPIYTIINFTQ